MKILDENGEVAFRFDPYTAIDSSLISLSAGKPVDRVWYCRETPKGREVVLAFENGDVIRKGSPVPDGWAAFRVVDLTNGGHAILFCEVGTQWIVGLLLTSPGKEEGGTFHTFPEKIGTESLLTSFGNGRFWLAHTGNDVTSIIDLETPPAKTIPVRLGESVPTQFTAMSAFEDGECVVVWSAKTGRLYRVIKNGVAISLVGGASFTPPNISADGNMLWLLRKKLNETEGSAEFYVLPLRSGDPKKEPSIIAGIGVIKATGLQAITPIPSEHRAVVLADGGGLWVVDGKHPEGKPVRLFGTVAIMAYGAVEGGNWMWAQRNDDSFYFFNPEGIPKVTNHSEPLSRKIRRGDSDHFKLLPGGQWIWGAMAGSAKVLRVDLHTGQEKPLSWELPRGEAVGGIVPAGDNRHVWVRRTFPEGGIYLATQDGELLNGGQPFQQVADSGSIGPTPHGDHAWFVGSGGSGYVRVGVPPDSEPVSEFIAEFVAGDLVQVADGRRAWAVPNTRTRNGVVSLLGCDREMVTDLKVTIDGKELPATNAATTIMADLSMPITVDFRWPGWSEQALPNGKTTVTLTGTDLNQDVFTGERKNETTEWKKPFRLSALKPAAGEYSVEVDYSDTSGTHLVFRWPSVTFKVPPVAPAVKELPPWVKAFGIWMLLIFLFVLVGKVTDNPAVQQWGAFGGAVLTQSAIVVFAQFKGLDWPTVYWFGGIGFVIFVAAVAAAMIGPRTFGELARVPPLGLLLPRLARWPRWRKALLAKPAVKAGIDLKAALGTDVREKERYASLPVIERTPEFAPRSEPAAFLKKMLCDPQGPRAVVIEGTGGLGKSALLRETARLCLEEFKKSGRAPVPVFCSGAEAIAALVKKGLEPDKLLESVSEELLDRGWLLVVIDGLSETGLPAEEVTRFLARVDARTRLLCSMRPNEALLRAFGHCEHLRVEPVLLDKAGVETMVKAYRSMAVAKGEQSQASATAAVAKNEQLPAAVADGTGGNVLGLDRATLEVCLASDKSGYLPVLVRFALLTGGTGVASLRELYGRAFDALLKGKAGGLPGATGAEQEELREKARALCIDVYWKSQSRRFHKERGGNVGFAPIIRRLREAGILVPPLRAEVGPEKAVVEVGFFHDSMEIFLTAEALAVGTDEEQRRALVRAAGYERFLVRDDAGRMRSELFEMCLAVFEPTALRGYLTEDLGRWEAPKFSRGFGVATVQEALGVEFATVLGEVTDSKVAIKQALGHVAGLPAKEQLRPLAALYAALAPAVWHKL